MALSRVHEQLHTPARLLNLIDVLLHGLQPGGNLSQGLCASEMDEQINA